MARYSVPTTILAISTVLSSLEGRKILAMEEGPMAGWLYRNLNEKVDQFVVSEPRRNKLVSSEGDRDDRIDSGKLAVLLRGNFLKAVHHTSDDHRAHLKHWINLYHDRIRDAVRDINKIRACCRMHGVSFQALARFARRRFLPTSIPHGGSRTEPSCTSTVVSGLSDQPVEKTKRAGPNRPD